MTAIFELFKKNNKHETGIFANIADYVGISLDDMKRSNKLAVEGIVPPNYPNLLAFSDGTEETIESLVNMFLECGPHCCLIEFNWYCSIHKKSQGFYDTITLFWMSNYDFINIQENFRISNGAYNSVCFWIKPKHILYSIDINKNILEHIDTIIFNFGLNFHDVYNMIIQKILDQDENTIENAFNALKKNYLAYNYISKFLIKMNKQSKMLLMR